MHVNNKQFKEIQSPVVYMLHILHIQNIHKIYIMDIIYHGHNRYHVSITYNRINFNWIKAKVSQKESTIRK